MLASFDPAIRSSDHYRGKRVVVGVRRPEVAEVLIRQSSQPGEVVVDPFMGSGSVGVAAARLGRRFLGNDRDGS